MVRAKCMVDPGLPLGSPELPAKGPERVSQGPGQWVADPAGLTAQVLAYPSSPE